MKNEPRSIEAAALRIHQNPRARSQGRRDRWGTGAMLRMALVCPAVTGVCWLLLAGAVQAQGTGGCVPPPVGLVSWWRGEGNAFDVASTNNGVLLGGMGFINGLVGTGFAFSGSGDDYVQLPRDLFPYPVSGSGQAPFSFELWFKTSSDGVILGQQDVLPFNNPVAGNVPALYVGTNGTLHAAMFWDAGQVIYSFASVADGAFHHAAVTFDGQNETLYLDGVAIFSQPFTQQSYAGHYQYQLGTGYTDGWLDAPGGWFPFSGVVDEASLYSRALSATEVAAIYQAGSAGKCGPPGGAVLRHRYSFKEPAGSLSVADSVQGANGLLLFASATAPYTNGVPDGSGFTGTGQLNLAGTNGFVALPSGLISNLSQVTLEVWVAWNGPATSTWQRICDFGVSDLGPNASSQGTNYFILCPARGGSGLLSFEETTVNPFGSTTDPKSLILEGNAAMPLGRETHLALTYDPLGGLCQLFVNGALVSSASGTFNPLSQFRDVNDWLGRSQWQRDPFFNGQYDEFRIWEGVLSPQEIASHFAVGPDQQFIVSRPVLSLFRSGANAVLSWPTTGNFRLQSTLNLVTPNWLDVTNAVTQTNSLYQVIVPVQGDAAFYRLKF